jgi:hypothetical protein
MGHIYRGLQDLSGLKNRIPIYGPRRLGRKAWSLESIRQDLVYLAGHYGICHTTLPRAGIGSGTTGQGSYEVVARPIERSHG